MQDHHISGVESPRLRLRLVETDDAAYIHRLRTSPEYNQHLSPVTGTQDDQRAWIEGYKVQEATGHQLYFVVERLDTQMPCGLVRLYDIVDDRFTWGSIILDQTKPPKAALEVAVLSFGVGFEALGKPLALVDVRRDNTHATAFYRRFGMTEVSSDEQDIFFEYSADQFRRDKPRHLRVIEEATRG